jgi:hypothetical protein
MTSLGRSAEDWELRWLRTMKGYFESMMKRQTGCPQGHPVGLRLRRSRQAQTGLAVPLGRTVMLQV